MSSRFHKLASRPAFRVGIGVSLLLSVGLGLWLLRPTDQFNYAGLKCQASTAPAAPLNAQQLTDILLLAERSKTASVQNVLPSPACSLPELELRPGAMLKRNVYRLGFDPQLVLIVGIEGDEYVGFKLRGLKEGATTVIADRPLTLFQKWQVKVGDQVNGAQVIGSLGQVSIKLTNREVVAPFDASVAAANAGCARLDGLEVPGYAFLFCGLERYHFGLVNRGKPIGSGSVVLVGVLRRQSDGAWAFVEPSSAFVGMITAK